MKSTIATPNVSGLTSFKAAWKQDFKAGFLVFLIALPLSLGIAKASGFPPAMGVVTAIVGGLFTGIFKVSALSIKGPAAGLITIAAASVIELGGGEMGWKAACGVIVVMAALQILFGFLKFGSLSAFFPHSAVHGMLAAIGIIIIAKQIPVLLGDDPTLYKGETPLQLLMDIPRFVEYAHWHIALIGIVALVIMFSLPLIKLKLFKAVPAPMIVLVLAIPLALLMHFRETEPAYSLVMIGDFWGMVGINADFSLIGTFPFWKYVFMFLFVSSLESLLTVKAVDNLDPLKRTSDYNGDLKGQGAGNVVSGLLGGLPMISEVVRSSANIGFGALTKWSNFFHGALLLIAMLVMIPIIEMIPNAALAAMLIYAGYRLAAPREFIHTYKIGKEQLVIFLVTIALTLLEDLLVGVAAGILVKILFHLYNGAKLGEMFKANYRLEEDGDTRSLYVEKTAAFSNLIAFKKVLNRMEGAKKVRVHMENVHLVDHSFMEFLTQHMNRAKEDGVDFQIVGLDQHRKLSDHELATHVRKRVSKKNSKKAKS